MKAILAALAIATSGASGLAIADPFVLYGVGGAGTTHIKAEPFSESSTAFNLGVGMRLNNNFSIELNNANFGRFDSPNGDLNRIKGVTGGLLVATPLSKRWSVFARADYGFMKTKTTRVDPLSGLSSSFSDREGKMLYGAGLQLDLRKDLFVRMQYQTIKLDNRLSAYTLQVTKDF